MWWFYFSVSPPTIFVCLSKERFFLEHNSSLVLCWEASRVLTDRPFLVQPSVNLPPLLWQSTLTLAFFELTLLPSSCHLVRVFSSSFLPMRLASLSSLLWSLLAYVATRSKLISVVEFLRYFGNRSGLISGALDGIPKLQQVLPIALPLKCSKSSLPSSFKRSVWRKCGGKF